MAYTFMSIDNMEEHRVKDNTWVNMALNVTTMVPFIKKNSMVFMVIRYQENPLLS